MSTQAKVWTTVLAFVLLAFLLVAFVDPERPANLAAAPTAPATAWEYTSEADALTGKSTRFACVDSINRLDFGFPYNGGSTGMLCFRDSPRFGKSAYLQIKKGQFLCGIEGCALRVRADNGPITMVRAIKASDGSSDYVFFRSYGTMLAVARAAKSLKIEAEYFKEGWQVLQFDPSGLKWQ
jgi:hypothetical protein